MELDIEIHFNCILASLVKLCGQFWPEYWNAFSINNFDFKTENMMKYKHWTYQIIKQTRVGLSVFTDFPESPPMRCPIYFSCDSHISFTKSKKICRKLILRLGRFVAFTLRKFGKQIKKKNDIQSFSLKWEKRKKRKIT